MNKSEKIIKIIEVIFMAVISAIITIVLPMMSDNMVLNILSILMAYFICGIVIYYSDILINKMKFFRPYKEYEGRWIEIIPGFSRKLSVCQLKYAQNQYHFDGHNFSDDLKKRISFVSTKFIDNGKDGFYYILKSNQEHHPEGYGKIYYMEKNEKGYYTAKGYFFDVSVIDDPQVHYVEMIKFDKNFYDNKHVKLNCRMNPRDMDEQDIAECVQEYIAQNYDLEVPLCLQKEKNMN